MLVDPEGRFLTQRHLAKLARFDVTQEDDALRISVDRSAPLEVKVPSGGRRVEARIWNDTVSVLDSGPEAASWLEGRLGRPCRLVYQDADGRRPVDSRYRTTPGDEVSLADGYPILLTNRASLDELNGRLRSPVPMNRFRPNLVIEGAEAFAEDTWRSVQIGEVELALVKPCARCAVTTIDQESGTRGSEPLRTLADYRSVRGKVLFGQNAIPLTWGDVRVGDPVRVLA